MADNVKHNIDSWKKRLDELLHDKDSCMTPIFEKFEAKTGVKRLNLVLGFVAFISVYLMVGYGADFLCNFIGFIYPAYASVKAIESREKDDDTKWLTYWVVFSVFSLVEFFADIFLFWIPLYWFFKCVFLVYCMAPFSWNGSIFIYHRFIRPFVLKHEKKIDSAIDVAADYARSAVGEVKEQAEAALKDHALTKQE
jgi:receptor expression-enhancing protein 5/6